MKYFLKSLQDSAAEGNRNQDTYVQTFSFESNGQNEGKCKQNSDLEIKVTRNAFLKMFFLIICYLSQ